MHSRGEAAFDAAFFLREEAAARVMLVLKDKPIFVQGSHASSMYFIRSGRVKISVTSADGREAIVAVLGANSFFGEGCLAIDSKNPGSATTCSDTIVMKIEKPEILRVLRECPPFAHMFLQSILAKIARANDDLVDQHFSSTEKRLARILWLMAEFDDGGRAKTIVDPLSQTTLAQMIGSTRARVSSFMNKFRKLGYVDYNGHLQIHGSLGIMLGLQGEDGI